ncbi:MAG: DsbA family protein [Proteobacteria bacterium]|nr:DsbA family protein [Pseudomonadota bacterium]
MTETTTLYYFHDPMCSWCYGFAPTWQQLGELLPASITVQYVAGGLAADSDAPMSAEMATHLQGIWRQIEQTCDVSFNHQFWQHCQPRRSTYPACRAVIAAGNKQKEMIAAIQNAYYQQAQNPSDRDTLTACAATIGLAPTTFLTTLQAEATEQELQRQLKFTRQCFVNGFPALRLQHQSALYEIPVRYGAAAAMAQDITNAIL